jgi:hypothetical protein
MSGERGRIGLADTAVSITAIVVSGIVGPGLSAWWTWRRQRDDHERTMQVELRTVLDEGANAVGNAKRCFERVYNLCREDVDRQSVEMNEAAQRWRAAMRDVHYLEDRMAIRLGEDHPVHDAFVTWIETLDLQRRFARGFERGELSPRLIERQREGHEAFEPARRRYVDEARRLVGPRLK